MKREYYSNKIEDFLCTASNQILGILVKNNDFPLEQTQRDAWIKEISLLQNILVGLKGKFISNIQFPGWVNE